LEQYIDMADDGAIKTILNGTRTIEAANCLTLSDSGFTIGTDATNGNDNTLAFYAIG